MIINLIHKENVEERGYQYLHTYEVYDYVIDKQLYVSSNKCKYIRVKCTYCGKEYDIVYGNFINQRQHCSNCCNKYENSFAYHIQVELGESLNKYWDWEKNTVNPYHIYKRRGSKSKKFGNTKIWIKCNEKDYHGSYDTNCADFSRGRRCPYCNGNKIHQKDSFAQYCIDNIDSKFMAKYWGKNNPVEGFSIAPKTQSKKVWIKCQLEDYHEEYLVSPSHFIDGSRCPYCAKRPGNVHHLDSFGEVCKDKLKYWSENNKVSPYSIAPRTGIKYLFICQDCGKEFKRSPHILWNCDDVRCLECSRSKGEKEVIKLLTKYGVEFEEQKTFSNLLGLCGGKLSYDFYLPTYNLLIEYQGAFHDGTATQQSKYELERQREHDKRKKNYAKSVGIKLLEIWYSDFKNIENILISEINKIKENVENDVI